MISIFQQLFPSPINLGGFGVFLLIGLLIGVAIYAFIANCVSAIAKKTDTPHAWLAWVPILSTFLILSIAGLPSSLAFVWFVPTVLGIFESLLISMTPSTEVLSLARTLSPIGYVSALISTIFYIFIWARIAQRRGKAWWFGVLAVIPLVNFFAIGHLAFYDNDTENGGPMIPAVPWGNDMGTYAWHHPERVDGESFIGNFTKEDFATKVVWQSKRIGDRAFDRNGYPEKDASLHPVFANSSELRKAGIPIS